MPTKKQAGIPATIDEWLATNSKQFGTPIRLLSDTRAARVHPIATGILPFDRAFGCGGLPRGRVTEIYGMESGGKTSLCMYAVAAAQRIPDKYVIYIDSECSLDLDRLAQCGADVPRMIHIMPDDAEQALGIAWAAAKSNLFSLIVIDSIAALATRAELAGEMGDATVASLARLMSKAMRLITGALSKSDCALICVNQLREKVGVMFGNPEVTSGGKALKFYTSVRIDTRRVETLKKNDVPYGIICKARFVKNKVGPPFKQVLFTIYFDGPEAIGISDGLYDLGLEYGLLTKKGYAVYYGDRKLGAGKDEALETIRGDPELRAALDGQIRRAMQPQETFEMPDPETIDEEEFFAVPVPEDGEEEEVPPVLPAVEYSAV